MKLKYRGVTYEPLSIGVKFNQYPGTGKYRGVAFRFPAFIADAIAPEFELRYRGTAYQTGQPKAPAETAPTTTPSIAERLRRLMLNQHRQIQQREQSMLARIDAQVGLSLGDATQFRNHIQGYTPYHTWMDYQRSHAAMS